MNNNNQHHTPGPWRSGDRGLCIKTSEGYWVADLQLYSISYAKAAINDAQRIANADLIAAAPELLEALQQVYTRLELEESENPNGTYLCAAMRGTIGRAIKKAKGEIE